MAFPTKTERLSHSHTVSLPVHWPILPQTKFSKVYNWEDNSVNWGVREKKKIRQRNQGKYHTEYVCVSFSIKLHLSNYTKIVKIVFNSVYWWYVKC